MAQFTFIELHFDELSIAPNLPFSGAGTTEETTVEDQEEGSSAAINEESDGGLPAKALVVVLGLLVTAAVLRYLRSGSDEDEEDLVETDSVDVTVGSSSE